MPESTAPIGFDEQGNPIEEVVTTAKRIRFPWMQLLAGAALGLLVVQLVDEAPRQKRRKAKRAKR